MLFGLFADIHGCYRALFDGIKALEPYKLDRLFLVGDAIHKGDNPQDMTILRDLMLMESEIDVVRGNREEEKLNSDDTLIPFDQDIMSWLRSVPNRIYLTDGGILLVHSLSDGLERELDLDLVRDSISKLRFGEYGEDQLRRIFFAHTHTPAIYRQRRDIVDEVDFVLGEEVRLDPNFIYAIGLDSLNPYLREPGNELRAVTLYDTDRDSVTFIPTET